MKIPVAGTPCGEGEGLRGGVEGGFWWNIDSDRDAPSEAGFGLAVIQPCTHRQDGQIHRLRHPLAGDWGQFKVFSEEFYKPAGLTFPAERIGLHDEDMMPESELDDDYP